MKVCVIGSGAAGVSSAIFLAERGFDVLVVGMHGASHISPWNVMIREDLEERMLRTGIKNERRKLRLFVENYSLVLEFFDRIGVKYRKSNIGVVPVGKRPSGYVMSKIKRHAKKLGVIFINDEIKGLRYRENTICSVIGEKEYVADIFVMAIGGLGNLYLYSTYSLPSRALHPLLAGIGVEYRNLAYNMFHPFLIVDERLPKALLSGEVLSRLEYVDDAGKGFLSEKVSNALKNNEHHHIFDVMTREFYLQSKKSGMWAVVKEDLSDLLDNEFGWIIEKMVRKKIKRFRIHPAFHYSIGGIATDESCRTNFDNVYAVGECATGLHGVNRVGGTSVAECVIFSHIMSENLEHPPSSSGNGKRVFAEIPTRKQKMLFWEHLGIVKKRETLKEISEMKENQIEAFAAMMAEQSLKSEKLGTNWVE